MNINGKTKLQDTQQTAVIAAVIAAVFFAASGCVPPAPPGDPLCDETLEHDARLSLQLDFELYGDPESDVTVIFESGGPKYTSFDIKGLSWEDPGIASAVGESAQALVYERAGICRSASSSQLRTAENIVALSLIDVLKGKSPGQ